MELKTITRFSYILRKMLERVDQVTTKIIFLNVEQAKDLQPLKVSIMRASALLVSILQFFTHEHRERKKSYLSI